MQCVVTALSLRFFLKIIFSVITLEKVLYLKTGTTFHVDLHIHEKTRTAKTNSKICLYS